ncbi:MAG: hypothetical protein PUI98_07380 [Finegoldia magna]|nr:hypothetical protein [Finegoldia magna]
MRKNVLKGTTLLLALCFSVGAVGCQKSSGNTGKKLKWLVLKRRE